LDVSAALVEVSDVSVSITVDVAKYPDAEVYDECRDRNERAVRKCAYFTFDSVLHEDLAGKDQVYSDKSQQTYIRQELQTILALK